MATGAVLLLTLATQNTNSREQLAAVRDMCVETVTEVRHLHARTQVYWLWRDAWRDQAFAAERRPEARSALGAQAGIDRSARVAMAV